MNPSGKGALRIARGAMICALYVVLTVLSNAFGLASGVIQVRISESLTILPVFFPEAIPGLWLGCLISNLITGCHIIDVIFGSIATLIGAYGTYLFRKTKVMYLLPPILMNMLIVPPVLMYAYQVPDAWWFLVLTVGAGEVISVGIFGGLLKGILSKYKTVIFNDYEEARATDKENNI